MSWGAVIGGAVSLVGGALANRSSNRGADRAAQASEQAAREANALNREIWQQTRTDNEPFRQSAVTANSQLMQLLGLGGMPVSAPSLPPSGQPGTPTGGIPGGLPGGREAIGSRPDVRMAQGQTRGNFQGIPGYVHGPSAGTGGPGQVQQTPAPAAQTPEQQRQAAFDLWRGTPGYQFNLDEGRRQIESSAAARGGLYSGAALRDLTQYGQNYADRTYDDHMNSLRAMAGQGQVVNSQNAQMGANYASNAGGNIMNAGANRASGLYQQGQNNAQLWAGAAGVVNNGLQGWLGRNQWGGI